MKESKITKSSSETREFGKEFAESVIQNGPQEKAVVLGLTGELGGGKTTFLQGFAKGLEIEDKILSPTFILMNRFGIPHYEFNNFYHIDCYRVDEEEEIEKLGFSKIISSNGNIVAIEWADKISNLLPKERINITFTIKDEETRQIIVNNPYKI